MCSNWLIGWQKFNVKEKFDKCNWLMGKSEGTCAVRDWRLADWSNGCLSDPCSVKTLNYMHWFSSDWKKNCTVDSKVYT